MFRAVTCLYCGAPIAAAVTLAVAVASPGPSAPGAAAATLPPEVLMALVPRERADATGRRWIVRVAAALMGTLLAASLLAGSCHKG
jgi:hypothetical protein